MKLRKSWKHKVASYAVLAMVSLWGISGSISALAAKSPSAEDIIKPNKITSSEYAVNQDNKYISKISVGTTVYTLWNSFGEKDYVTIFDKNDNTVAGETMLGTGMVASIMDEGTSVSKYTVIVTGDTNGDGKINITDMIAVKACTLKKSDLSGVYEKAGDVNGDGKINITDFIKVKATTLKKDTVAGVEVR